MSVTRCGAAVGWLAGSIEVTGHRLWLSNRCPVSERGRETQATCTLPSRASSRESRRHQYIASGQHTVALTTTRGHALPARHLRDMTPRYIAGQRARTGPRSYWTRASLVSLHVHTAMA